MNRRHFLKRFWVGAAALASAPFLARCGVEEAAALFTSVTITGTQGNSGHTHTATFLCSLFSSPSAGGISLTTSSGSGHTHTLTMTKAQLDLVQAGTPQVITVTLDGTGDNHQFTVAKGTCT